jgi:hypothetical protein
VIVKCPIRREKMKSSKYIVLIALLCMVVITLTAGDAVAKWHKPYHHWYDGCKSWDNENMECLGYNDVQGRETLQVTTNGNFAFIGHHNRPSYTATHYNPITDQYEENGTTILNIKNPKRPWVVVHIPNITNRNSRSTSVVYDFMGSGRDFLIRNSEGYELDGVTRTWYFQVFDITDITRDGGTAYFEVGKIKSSPVDSCGTGCGGIFTQTAHKGYFSPSGWYYAAANEPGFRSGGHLMVWDLSDLPDVVPDEDQDLNFRADMSTRFVGRAWLPGQKLTEPDVGGLNWHHPVVNEAMGQVYGGYLTGGNVVAADISTVPSGPDLRFPNIWSLDLGPNQRAAGHTPAVIRYDDVPNIEEDGLPMYFCLHSEEGTGGDMNPPTQDMRTKAYMIDVTDATGDEVATVVETWQVPNDGYVYKGGRFGPHQFAETQNSEYNLFEDRIAYFAYFNAGVRAVDISDPYNLKEVGHFVPMRNKNTNPVSTGQIPQIQINDVDVDYRGLVMATDRVGSGFYILKYTGPKAGCKHYYCK